MGIADYYHRYGLKANAYDWLKCLAVITMTVDHLGMYWWPNELDLRLVGRIAFPIFFFLVGYSLRYKAKSDLLIAAGICVALNPFTYQPVFALNALVAVIMARYAMPLIVKRHLLEKQPLIVLFACMLFLLPLLLLVEYGTFAILFACMGYMQRQHLRRWDQKLFWAITLIVYFFVQHIWFAFTPQQSGTLMVFLALTAWMLYRFNHEADMPELPKPANGLAKAASRYSLHYYVIHKIFIQTVAAFILMDESEQFFRWIDW